LSLRLILLAFVIVATIQGLAATAPLTGSDALFYHFTVPLNILHRGFQPDFFLPHMFLTGQGHVLIFAALALGSEKVALAVIFIAGVLSALAAACFARQWLCVPASTLVGVAVLLNPVAFWQFTTSGCPDIWMAAFVTCGVLCVATLKKDHSAGMV